MRRIMKISIALPVALAALWLVPGHVAHADKDEASLHAHVQFGRATMGDLYAPDRTDAAPFLGVGARATYAISNWYAFEGSLWLAELARPVRYSIETRTGKERHWDTTWAQANLGVTARLGVRIIPTLHGALGLQRRIWQGQEYERVSGFCPPDEDEAVIKPCSLELNDQTTMELLGTLGAGLDLRLGDHWITGLAVTAQRSVVSDVPFQTIAAIFHFSYYFYPEGAGP